ncbi:MAG: PAS domain-containing protein [Paracoccaceae bacterium]
MWAIPHYDFDKNTRRRFEAVLADVMNRPNIPRLGLGSIDKMGNEAQAEMILLPLRNDFGEVSRIIGCVTTPTARVHCAGAFQSTVCRHRGH